MKKELNNKGFSLVELIIVIAIMAVLMGVLAPQYLKYVKQSKISTDITNAEEMATAINVAVADGVNTSGADKATAPSNSAFAGSTEIVSKSSGTKVYAPYSKVKKEYKWKVDWNNTDGVKKITLNGWEIWPTSTEYEKEAKNV